MAEPDPTQDQDAIDGPDGPAQRDDTAQTADETGRWVDDEIAQWWQDEFTDGVDPEYVDQILPLIVASLGDAPTVVDIGTGEGQAARALAACGANVWGIDPMAAQVRVATERGGGPLYVQGEAAALPYPTDSMDAALASLVFEHIDDLDGAVAEIARVLRPGGRFLFLLNHPLLQTPDSGWIDDQVLDPPEQYWRIGPYLVEQSTIEEVSLGVHIRFVHRPLSRYLNTLFDHGLILERMDEPAPPQSFLDLSPHYTLAGTVPRLLALHLRRQ